MNNAATAGSNNTGDPMRRVTGIGGIFFKAKNPAALHEWYKRHLGIDVQDWGGAIFPWADEQGQPVGGTTVWSIGSEDDASYAPSAARFRINYRVDDVRGLVKVLRDEGCEVLDDIEESGFGIFAWVMDPEGNKVELWQPPSGQ